MGRKLLVAIVAASAIAGCGSSSKTTTRPSSASSHPNGAGGTSITPRYASTYPPGFDSAFLRSCTVSRAACQCILTQIESAVSYSTARASINTIRAGHPPSWYTSALASCAGK